MCGRAIIGIVKFAKFHYHSNKSKQVLLVGGKDTANKPNGILWQSSLGEAKLKQLSWVPLTLEVLSARSNPTYFKFKEHS